MCVRVCRSFGIVSMIVSIVGAYLETRITMYKESVSDFCIRDRELVFLCASFS